jgi:hypothetical protein
MCTSVQSLDNSLCIQGTIRDEATIPIDSALVTITNIIASEGHQAKSKIGTTYVTDSDGHFSIHLSNGTTWKENAVTGNKEYTKYIDQVELKISKQGFNDTVYNVKITDYTVSNYEADIILRK